MMLFLLNVCRRLRPAFHRTSTFTWFVLVICGFVLRSDHLGVSSLVRALSLPPSAYLSLLHFFHSSAWSAANLLTIWSTWIISAFSPATQRMIMVGDHTYAVKDARKMPEVITIHQNSETSSKPSFFRGHFWAALGCWLDLGEKGAYLPLWTEIHRTDSKHSRATRMIVEAAQIAKRVKRQAILVLDAFFAVGPAFEIAMETEGQLDILVRAKKNVTAYESPLPSRPGTLGRKKKYGRRHRVMDLFDTSKEMQQVKLSLYGKNQIARGLAVNLLWKPVKTMVRFILIESDRGRLILMTTDLVMTVEEAARLYCRRAVIESFFSTLKNLLGGMKYHFWSKYLSPLSRRPLRNESRRRYSSQPKCTANTLEAIEKFVAVQTIVFGIIQLFAVVVPHQIYREAKCWLRTPCGNQPSPFVARLGLCNWLLRISGGFAKRPMTRLIQRIAKKAS